MLSRHVDFFAILIITLGLLASSQVSAFDSRDRGGSVNFQNAIDIQYCPVPEQVISNLVHYLDR